MEENIYVQLYIFLFTLYGGLIIGIIYDLMDILLNRQNTRFKGRGKTDLFFWLLAIIIILGILFYSNDGKIRVYTLLGFALGWVLYFWLLSSLIRRTILYILRGLTILIGYLLNILLFPIKWLYHLFYRPYLRIFYMGRNIKTRLKKYFQLPGVIMGQFRRYKKYFGKKGS